MLDSLQSLCELGQQQLMRLEYLIAEKTLMGAEQIALQRHDFETLGRLYMPLQEAHRQRRQRAGEGIVCLDLISNGPDDRVDGRHVVENFPHGQLLIAGWGTIEPALQARQLQSEFDLYLETFLAAAYPVGAGRAIAIIPLEGVKLPDPTPRSIDELIRLLPAHSIVLNESELPQGSRKGNSETFAQVCGLWERLHAPFLAVADMLTDPVQKIEAYRKTIRVDYACELAHQKLSDLARQIARTTGAGAGLAILLNLSRMSDYGYGYRRRGPDWGRLLIGVIIAIGGLIAYWSRTEVNPVTGEKQHIALNVDQEKAMGLHAAPEMAQQMGGALDPRSDPNAAKVAQLGQLLVQRSDARKSPYADNFNFYLLRDPQTVNAFALPGGQIFITRALYDRLQNEAQLAGVLGHEIGHVINRHAAEHMAKGQLGSALVTAVGVGASDERGRGQMAAYAAMMANQMLQLKYSRNDELESDQYGLKYMSQTGFSPAAMLEVMRILKEASGTRGGSSIFATHPDPDARIEQIQEHLKKNPPSQELSMGKSLR